jgi:aspartate oxidase
MDDVCRGIGVVFSPFFSLHFSTSEIVSVIHQQGQKFGILFSNISKDTVTISSMKKTLDVIVVGAGIGGLATALALATDGHRVTVLDAVKEFTEVDFG